MTNNCGIVKQILSGDSIIIKSLRDSAKERQINFVGVTAPKLGRKDIPEEQWAWEAREYLRKRLIGQDVLFIVEKHLNSNREYGYVFLKNGTSTPENIVESIVSEGLVTVRRGAPPRLLELENNAKELRKGKWSNQPLKIRDVKRNIDEPKTLFEKLKDKPQKAIVERVKDGSTILVCLLPDFYYITLMISNVRAPHIKIDVSSKPDLNTNSFANEARYFTEELILQRDVEICLQSVSHKNFFGSVTIGKINVAEALLRHGLARLGNWSSKPITNNLKVAEETAKSSRLGIWKTWQPETSFIATVVEINNGESVTIKSNDGESKKVFLFGIKQPKEFGKVADKDGKSLMRSKGFRPLYDIPYMFEAREFLRKTLIGKKVRVKIDYIQEAKDEYPEKIYVTIFIGDKNVAEALVGKGLATVNQHKSDDDQRSFFISDLHEAQNNAIKNQFGIHNKKEAPLRRVTEILDQPRAKHEIQSFRDSKVDAIVEYVVSGSRLRLFIVKSSSLCTFLLAGIKCPLASRTNKQVCKEGDPFGDEALQFTKDYCYQRVVSIHAEGHDKAGNLIGWLWIENVNLSVALVKEGFASVLPIAEKSQHWSQLKEAENKARKNKLRIWRNYVDVDVSKLEEEKVNFESKTNYEDVIVTEITSDGTFFAQHINEGPKVEALHVKLRQDIKNNPPFPGAYSPRKGDICIGKYTVDNDWYRVKIEKIENGKAKVLYIDYGNREVLEFNRLANLASNFVNEKPYATEYSLPYVTLPKDDEFRTLALQYLKQDTFNKNLRLHVQYRLAGMPAATLICSESGDIIKNLVEEGLMLVENKKFDKQNKVLLSYKEAQEEAKRKHSQIWEYGDITEVDAKEFGYSQY